MITLNHPMIKELSLAVIFGLLIGFGLTGTFYFVKKNSHYQPNTPNFVVPTPGPDSQVTPTTIISSTSTLQITSPQDNDIINTSKITLEGIAAPNSFIIITTSLNNYHLAANSQGNFSVSINLEPGINFINLSSIDQNDQETHAQISLTYSTTKLE